jgi:predicted transposase YdaD
MTLEDSTTYQDILSKGLTRGRAEGIAEGKAEGRVEGKAELAKKILIQFGRKWFGSASPDAEAAIFAISNLDQLERMVQRLDEASGWEDLLATT